MEEVDKLSLNNTKWKLYRFALKVGLSSLLRANYVIGLKQFLYPVGYWRFPVLPIVADLIGSAKHGKILDIGSPKLLSLFLSLYYGHEVHATDIHDRQIFDRYQKHWNDFLFRRRNGNYIVEFQDARSLQYPDESFDWVYAISVLEHIPEDGDAKAMQEIARVLKFSGKAIIEIPYALENHETYIRKTVYNREYNSEPVFYQRHYDEKTFLSRLVLPSGLSLIKKTLIGERLPFEHFWQQVPDIAKKTLLWTESFFSTLNHYYMTESGRPRHGLHNNCAMSVIIVLEKK
jgi:SAM-dependent methyltransferase